MRSRASGDERVPVPPGRSLGDEATKVLLLRLLGRRLERRQVEVPELDRQIAPFGDSERVVARVRPLGEQRAHLLGGLEVELLRVELEPSGLVDLGVRLDAQQRVVRAGVRPLRVVEVVGRDERGAEPAGQLDELWRHLALFLEPVVLELDEVVLRPEDVPVRAGHPLGLGVVPDLERRADLAGQTAREPDQALRMRSERLLVDARPVVVALEPAGGHQPHEVPVPGIGRGDDRQVVVEVLLAGGLLEPAPGRDVELGPDDRLDPCLLAGLEVVDRSVHDPVVGDRDRRHAQAGGLFEQGRDPGGAVKDRILGVVVQMDETAAHGRPLQTGRPESHGCHSALFYNPAAPLHSRK